MGLLLYTNTTVLPVLGHWTVLGCGLQASQKPESLDGTDESRAVVSMGRAKRLAVVT